MKIFDRPVKTFVDWANQEHSDNALDLANDWRTEVRAPFHAIYAAVDTWVPSDVAADALPDVLSGSETLLSAAERAHRAVAAAHARLAEVLTPEPEVQAVLLVGLGKANGWVAAVEDEPTLFLAVERLPDPPYDVVLALHELTHLVHLQRAANGWPSARVDADLFREGLAVHATTTLMPDIDRSGHLWFRKGEGAWIRRCEQLATALRGRALDDLHRTDQSEIWFSPDPPEAHLPPRCGYWLGWDCLHRLAKDAEVTLSELSSWPLDRVSLALEDVLRSGGSVQELGPA